MRPRLLIAVTVAALCAAAGVAAADTYNKAGLESIMVQRGGAGSAASRSEFSVGTLRGALRSVSLRARSGLRATMPKGAAGATLGTLALSTKSVTHRYTLRRPGTYAEASVLLQRGRLIVRLLPATSNVRKPRAFLNISGISGQVTSAAVTLRGAVLRMNRGCSTPLSVVTHVTRSGAGSGSVRAGQRC